MAGEVFTIEPGLYSRNFGGVRVEDMVVITSGSPAQSQSIARRTQLALSGVSTLNRSYIMVARYSICRALTSRY